MNLKQFEISVLTLIQRKPISLIVTGEVKRMQCSALLESAAHALFVE